MSFLLVLTVQKGFFIKRLKQNNNMLIWGYLINFCQISLTFMKQTESGLVGIHVFVSDRMCVCVGFSRTAFVSSRKIVSKASELLLWWFLSFSPARIKSLFFLCVCVFCVNPLNPSWICSRRISAWTRSCTTPASRTSTDCVRMWPSATLRSAATHANTHTSVYHRTCTPVGRNWERLPNMSKCLQ